MPWNEQHQQQYQQYQPRSDEPAAQHNVPSSQPSEPSQQSQQYQQQPQQQQYQQPQQQYQQNSYQNNDQGYQKPRSNYGGGYGGGNRGNYGSGNRGGYGGNRGGNNEGGFKPPMPPVENPVLYQPYGIMGNKDAPPKIIDDLVRIARKLSENGFTLRTGAMEGIEQIVDGAVGNGELYLPWRDFGGKDSKNTFNSPLAKGIAKKFAANVNWETLKPPVQAFLCKNVRVLTGQNCNSLALFLLCWSEDGAETAIEKTFATGNIGHAIAVAAAHRIPVFNLGKPDAEQRLFTFLGLNNGQAL